MLNGSLIQKSKQSWKLLSGIAIVLLGFFVMACGLGRLERPAGVNLALGGMGTGLLAFIAMCFAIRCRACGMRWLWAAMRNQEHLQWFNWLVAQRVCPRCGNDPGKQLAEVNTLSP